MGKDSRAEESTEARYRSLYALYLNVQQDNDVMGCVREFGGKLEKFGDVPEDFSASYSAWTRGSSRVRDCKVSRQWTAQADADSGLSQLDKYVIPESSSRIKFTGERRDG